MKMKIQAQPKTVLRKIDANLINLKYKKNLLKRKQFSCNPPPSIENWSDQNWIDWIDYNGYWCMVGRK